MPTSAIEVFRLGKRYPRIRKRRAQTLVERLQYALGAPWRNFRRLARRNYAGAGADDLIWVLQEVSFAVGRGEVLGIIGPNGAGKSTLLKILSRLTHPDAGQATLRGRIASLLEVGTGFHDELTGRDNIYLNATILGMARREVDEQLQAIIAFSEIERFIDTPIKFYSSGMKVRLAFAVAAHLSPEILIIDEVLAVGDLAFQRKCLTRMEAVARNGSTVLFVSHHMASVKALCERCIVIERGRVTFDGATAPAIERYQEAIFTRVSSGDLSNRQDRYGAGRIRFTRLTTNGGYRSVAGAPVRFEVAYRAAQALPNVQVTLMINRSFQEPLITVDSKSQGVELRIDEGEGRIVIELPFLPLRPGRYLVDLWANIASGTEDGMFHAANLEIVAPAHFRTDPGEGVLLPPPATWQLASPPPAMPPR